MSKPNEPTSILDFVNRVIDDLGVIDENHPDHDRVDIGWWEAMEAIKGLIEDRVPLLDWRTDGLNLSEEELLTFFDEDEPKEIARYVARSIEQGQFDMRNFIQDVKAYDPNAEEYSVPSEDYEEEVK